jgi:hypothetical protein
VLWIAAILVALYEPMGFVQTGFSTWLRLETPSLLFGLGVLLLGLLLLAFGSGGTVVDAVLANPWRYAIWLIGVPLVLLSSWLAQERLSYQFFPIALDVTALLLIFAGLRVRSKPPVPQEEVEREIDQMLEADIERHFTSIAGHLLVSKGAGSVPFPGYGQQFVCLRGFPDGAKLAGLPYRVRPGHDGRPRMTPHGFVVLAFGDEQLLLFDGAIDVVSGDIVYYRAQEVHYREITSLTFESQPTTSEVKRDASAMVQKLQVPGIRQVSRRRDQFAIGLPVGNSLSVVVRDDGMFEPGRGKPAMPLTDWAEVRGTWQNLSSLRQKALQTPRA